ncbi:diphosphomevalonate decarboxylase [Caviibacter abscessus]|uniref:diphosphomevalonate decarboxylase n=1 Tax=Caviibacter abscessus TaxID=1766719 RepID=UPI00082A4B15|nr:diphosphomevalonate decarboxylase [Caviibacter abscessus]
MCCKDMSISYMNIAIVKYWGKKEYNPYLIPLVPSISYRAKNLYTKTKIESSDIDEFYLNDKLQDKVQCKKIFSYIDKIVKNRPKLKVTSYNTMPTAAGLASSASAYSALIQEINKFFNLNLSIEQMAKYASIGSGSAGRSFYELCAFDENGNIYELHTDLNLCMSAIIISKEKKSISSRDAMQHCIDTSPYMNEWVEVGIRSFNDMKKALLDNDFTKIGEIMEYNTMFMHKTMKTANPPFTYLTNESIECIEYIKELRNKGYQIYFTTDAGPNVKVLYLKEDEEKIINKLKEKYKDKVIEC